MFSVSFGRGGSSRLQPYVKNCLKKASREGTIDAAICSGGRADLLILPPGASLCAGGNGLVLAMGQVPLPGIRSVSCGLRYGDDLTLSSIGADSAMLALQSDIPALNGTLLEPQEIPVTLEAPAEPEAVLAAAGAMLLLGADASAGFRLP
jgi:hypothetical protein